VYTLKEAVRGIVRTPYMSFIAVLTMTVTLTVLGLFAVATYLGNGFIQKIRKSEEINVYLRDSLSDEDMLALDTVIRAMEEVESTRIMSKEDAAREFERMYGEDLLSAIDHNPLPRTIVVVMSEGHRMSGDMQVVASRISRAKGVESVEYGYDWMSRLDIVFLFFVAGEFVLTVLGIGACILIISNTISLTVMTRRELIEIMRLVGATDGFIRRPFYVEGFIQGVCAGCLSAVLFYAGYRWLGSAVPGAKAYLMMFVPPKFVFIDISHWFAMLIPVGGITGLLGSFVAVRRVF